jgi:hypothetical protein
MLLLQVMAFLVSKCCNSYRILVTASRSVFASLFASFSFSSFVSIAFSIQESLRLHANGIQLRRVLKDVEIGGYNIPAGKPFCVHVFWAIHIMWLIFAIFRARHYRLPCRRAE